MRRQRFCQIKINLIDYNHKREKLSRYNDNCNQLYKLVAKKTELVIVKIMFLTKLQMFTLIEIHEIVNINILSMNFMFMTFGQTHNYE